MTIGGGFGSRGEVQITNETDETRRRISIRTAISMALALNGITLAAYIVVHLFWIFLLILGFDVPPKSAGLLRWWQCTAYVVESWWSVMRVIWTLWLLPLPIEWITPLWHLYTRNLYPKLLNDNWPPTWGQADPMRTGALTWANYDARALPQEPTEPPEPETIRVQVDRKDANGTHYTAGIVEMPRTLGWYHLCIWVLRNPDEFTEDTARRFGVPITLKHGLGFREVRAQLLDREWACWVNERAHGQGLVLFPDALDALKGWADRGPPPA